MNRTRAQRDVLRSRFVQSFALALAAMGVSGCEKVPLVKYAGDNYSVRGPGPISQNPDPGTSPPPPAQFNTAPAVRAGNDLTIELPTDHAWLAGTVTDDGLPAGNALQVQWRVLAGPTRCDGSPGVVFGDATQATSRARFAGGPGEYTLALMASDGALVTESTMHVSVKPNALRYPGNSGDPGHGWETVTPDAAGLDVARLDAAREYSRSRHPAYDEAGLIVRGGRAVYQWGDQDRLFEMKSVTKSIGGLTMLLALDEGQVSLPNRASQHLPYFGEEPFVDTTNVPGATLSAVTLLQLATHTSGLSKSDASGTRALLCQPATTWHYSDQALNSLADALTQVHAEGLREVSFRQFYDTLGIRRTDLRWRQNVYRTAQMDVNGAPVPRREFASGINANVNAMARVGLLMLRKGVWRNDLLLSNEVVESVRVPRPEIASAVVSDPVEFPDATRAYGLLWWTNVNGILPNVPRDAYWAWGLYDQLIVVIPSLDLAIVRAGEKGWRSNPDDWNGDYHVLAPFLDNIVGAVRN